ncbi:MAG: hypothetical protein L6R42_007583 [Xanthoria sp. 1 TBL-2021]|nr:MAG: hypothetical protein L6R42_007583 [Xanthoria sp. 1 TBL-2021]
MEADGFLNDGVKVREFGGDFPADGYLLHLEIELFLKALKNAMVLEGVVHGAGHCGSTCVAARYDVVGFLAVEEVVKKVGRVMDTLAGQPTTLRNLMEAEFQSAVEDRSVAEGAEKSFDFWDVPQTHEGIASEDGIRHGIFNVLTLLEKTLHLTKIGDHDDFPCG